MENNLEELSYNKNGIVNVLIGALVGGLAGATAMLLFAPQSGKRTRDQIQNKSIQLRDRTTKNINKNIKKVVGQVRSETNRITSEVQEKAGELKQFGQDKLVQQMDRMTAALDAGKTAVEAA